MSSWFGFTSSSSSSPGSKERTSGPLTCFHDDSHQSTEPHMSASRRRADEGAVFTSSKCPPGLGLENSCELPFAFVWTPMAIYNAVERNGFNPNRQEMATIESSSDLLPPVLCLACLAYLNPFAEMDLSTGVWACPLCGHENVVPREQLYPGSDLMTAIHSNVVEYRQQQIDLNDDDKGGKNSNGNDDDNTDDYDDEDYCTYVLLVDENLSPSDGQAIAPAIENLLKEQFEAQNDSDSFPTARIGLIVFGKSVSVYRLGLSPGLASADIYSHLGYAGDEDDPMSNGDTEKRAYLAEIQPGQSLTTLKNSLASVFGITVSPSASNATATKTSPSRMEILARRKEARIRKQRQHVNGSHVNGDNNGTVESPWVRRRQEAKTGHPKRCTGEAVQRALDLAGITMSHSKASRTSRILLFTNGCPNIGYGTVVAEGSVYDNKSKKGTAKKSPGRRAERPAHDVVDTTMLQKAVEYFDGAAKLAVSNGVGFDVFCSGVHELALPAYQALVEPSGGYVLPLLSFDETSQFQQNLKFLLENTYMSRSNDILDVDDEDAGAECILDIRTELFVTPTRMCGSGEVLPNSAARIVESERSTFAAGAALAANRGIKTNNLPSVNALESSMTRIQVGRVDPLSTFTVLLEINDSLEEDDEFAFFQLVSRYVSRNGREAITRVASFKLPIARDVSDFVASVDDEAVSVALGKAAVYRALHGREETSKARDTTSAGDTDAQEKLAYDTQLDLDATVQRISGAFRLLGLEEKTRDLSLSGTKGRETGQSSLDFAFPPQLKDTLSRLYHLRRGPLISPGPMRSMDDRAEIRGLFLRFPLEDCIQMMAPSMWSTGVLAGISSAWNVMDPFPAETLALWDSSIVAADFHDALFVWSGANCTAARYDGVRRKFEAFLLERAKDRFPMPKLHVLNDGDSMSRRFTALLAPSHADPIDNQLVHFPALSTLKPDDLKELRSKFRFYDSNSDASFRTWFWSVASATNVSREEGMSLSA